MLAVTILVENKPEIFTYHYSLTIWIRKWRKNGWTKIDGDPVKHQYHLETLENLTTNDIKVLA